MDERDYTRENERTIRASRILSTSEGGRLRAPDGRIYDVVDTYSAGKRRWWHTVLRPVGSAASSDEIVRTGWELACTGWDAEVRD